MNIEERVKELEQEIQTIKERNRKVEADKAWETSIFRTFSIAGATYVVTAAVFYLIGVNNFYLSALIPAAAYFVSVQSLPAVKRWWLNKLS